mgnify:CR=1 FL=1
MTVSETFLMSAVAPSMPTAPLASNSHWASTSTEFTDVFVSEMSPLGFRGHKVKCEEMFLIGDWYEDDCCVYRAA